MKPLLVATLAILMLAGCTDEDSAPPFTDPIEILKAAHVREIASALTQAYEQCERRNFDASIAQCNYVLSREPEYCVAVEFAEGLALAKTRMEEGDEFYFSFLMARVNNWQKLTSVEEARLPYVGGTAGDVLTYPHLNLPKAEVPDSKRAVDGFLVKVENRWPPDIGKQMAEEWSKDHPSHIVSGDKASDHVTLIVLEGDPLTPEDRQKFEDRVRELDCDVEQRSAQ